MGSGGPKNLNFDAAASTLVEGRAEIYAKVQL